MARFWLVLALTFGGAGCVRVEANCDQAAVEAVAERFESAPDEAWAGVAAAAGFEAACPGMPEVSAALACHTGASDPACPELLQAFTAATQSLLCPDGEARERMILVPRIRRNATFASSCRLQRFGVLHDDERAYGDDRPVWVLVAWLVSHGITDVTARRIARGLILSGTPSQLLRQRCLHDPRRDACTAFVAAHGVQLAQSPTLAVHPPDGVHAFIASDGIEIDGIRLAPLVDGTLRAVDLDNHRIGALGRRLADEHRQPDEPITVYPDVSLSYGVVVDAVYTAARSDVVDIGVAVEGIDVPDRIQAIPRVTWDPDDPRVYDLACALEARIEGQRVRMSWCGHDEVVVPAEDRRAIAEFVRRTSEGRSDRVLNVFAPYETPWSAVVQLINAVRKPATAFSMGGGPELETCSFCSIAFELDPPIPWRAGDWSRLRLRVGKITRQDPHRRRPTPPETAIRARMEAALPELETCLRESPAMQLRKPAVLTLMLGYENGTEAGFAVAGNATEMIPACFYAHFAPAPESPAHLVPGYAMVDFEVMLD